MGPLEPCMGLCMIVQWHLAGVGFRPRWGSWLGAGMRASGSRARACIWFNLQLERCSCCASLLSMHVMPASLAYTAMPSVCKTWGLFPLVKGTISVRRCISQHAPSICCSVTEPADLTAFTGVQLGANVVSWVGSQWRELLHRGPQRTESGDTALQYALSFLSCSSSSAHHLHGAQHSLPWVRWICQALNLSSPG